MKFDKIPPISVQIALFLHKLSGFRQKRQTLTTSRFSESLELSPFIGDVLCAILGKNRPILHGFQHFYVKFGQTADILKNSRIAFHRRFFERYPSNRH
jgi:hypothetical protein